MIADPPEILSFTASPDGAILTGDTISLSWETLHATGIQIVRDGGEAVDVDEADPGSGSVELVVDESGAHTFTLTATGEEGTDPASADVTVTVVDPDAPLILAFDAAPAEVLDGESVTLSWETAEAEVLELSDSDGNAVDLGEQSVAAGSVEVTPEASTTYTLTATGPGGEAFADASVTVRPRPSVIAFEVDPDEPVLPGTEVLLLWETEGALAVEIRANGETILESDTELTGVLPYVADYRTELEIVATGYLDAEASGTASIPVIPLIDVFVADETRLRAGDEATFEWETRGADRVVLSGPGGIEHVASGPDAAGGTFTTPVTTGGAFVLVAESGPLDDMQVIDVEITDAPRIHVFTASDGEVTAGESVTLTWSVRGADSLALEVTNLGEVDVSGLDPDDDQIEVTLPVPGLFIATLTATNASGSHERQYTVEAVGVPVIEVFTGLPLRVGSGEPVELSWDTLYAQSVRLEKDGVDLEVDPDLTTGQATDVVTADASYVLTATNRLGFEVVSESVSVQVAAPAIASFEASPSQVHPLGDVVFTWSSVGGTSLSVTQGDDTLCQTQSTAEIAVGSCTITAPLEVGAYGYVLQVSNGAGSDSQQLEVEVSEGPLVSGLTVSPEILTLGESFDLTWTVTPDYSGNTANLSLEDDLGNVYDLSGFDPTGATASIEPGDAGLRTFTFTASTGTGNDAVRIFDVDVIPAPAIVTFLGDPPHLETEGGTLQPTSTLMWEVADAVALTLWELDEQGDALTPALVESTDAGEIASGTHVVQPAETTHYRLVVENALGFEVAAQTRVVVDGASVTAFAATPNEIIEGETVTLSWSTHLADQVNLDPFPLKQVSGEYVDISATGTPFALWTTVGNRVHDIQFPPGFTFPYYGIERDEVRVGNYGQLSFQFVNELLVTRRELPFPDVRSPKIAVFWDAIRPKDSTNSAYYQFGTDDEGDYLIIQWHDFEFTLSSANPSSLNFQAVLRDNGQFEFHYGAMSSANDRHLGEWLSIGYENDDGTEGHSIFFRDPPIDLAGTGFIINEPLDAVGNLEVTPLDTMTYTLTAENDQGVDQAEVEVIVHPSAQIASVRTDPAEVQAGRDFDIKWHVQNASEVRVIGPGGDTLCVDEVDPSGVGGGICQVPAHATEGTVTYTIEAVSALPHHFVSAELEVEVHSLFEITSFELLEAFIGINEQMTVEWESVGGDTVDLRMGPLGEEPTSTNLVPGASPDSGSFTTQLTESRDIHLTVTAADGRVRTAVVTVYVNAAQIDDLSASQTVVSSGDTVTLTWQTSNADSVTLEPRFSVREIPSGFVDISATGTDLMLSESPSSNRHASVTFPAGFTFPYFGVDRTEMRIIIHGYLSFNMTSTFYTWINRDVPAMNTSQTPIIAPFWDQIREKAGEVPVYYEFGADAEGQFMRIQWDDLTFGRAAANPSSVSLQAVLRDNGVFEFHYGTMESDNESHLGSNATIGFENDDGTDGFSFSHNTVVPGGLENRSWRYQIYEFSEGTNSTQVTVQESETFILCATGGGYTDCQEIDIVVVGPGTVMISEIMPDPSVGADGQWIELHNTTSADLDLDGWTLSVDGDAHVISGSLVLPGNESIVLGRSGDTALNGGYVPDYVYGSDLLLQAAGSAIALGYDGVVIDDLVYDDIDWPILNGVSIHADPYFVDGDPDANLDPAVWCAGTETFGTAGQIGTPGEANAECLIRASLTSSPYLDVPDNDPIGALDVQAFDEVCTVLDVNVDVDIATTRELSISIDLLRPDGTMLRLRDPSGSTTSQYIRGNYPRTLVPVESLDQLQGTNGEGIWGLHVVDTGTLLREHRIDAWTLNLTCIP